MAPGISLDDRNAWDDSALIDSWEDALSEYKKYHSIQAQGKRLEDVLGEAELKELREEHRDIMKTEETEVKTEEIEVGVDSANNHADQMDTESNYGGQASQPVTQAEEQATPEQQKESAPAVSVPAVPQVPIQAILETVPDENLRNMMMSWYYAGYYTGLYTGQQQQQQQQKGV